MNQAQRLPAAIGTGYRPYDETIDYTFWHAPVAVNPGDHETRYMTGCGRSVLPERILWPEEVGAPLYPLCREGCW